MNRRIVLASSSPRRKDLLERIGLDFAVIPASVEEASNATRPIETARSLALVKATEVAGRLKGSLVIGADTIVVVNDTVLGKPHDQTHAREMLGILSGRFHRVITGVAIIDSDSGHAEVDHEESTVHIRDLNATEIDAYVRSGEPMDKAGSYAVQGIGSTIVDRIEGCYFNVVGLPMAKLSEMLARFGFHILR